MRRVRGFTLLEVTIAIFIFTAITLVVFTSLSTSARQDSESFHTQLAINAVRDVMSEVQEACNTNLGTVYSTYHGKTYTSSTLASLAALGPSAKIEVLCYACEYGLPAMLGGPNNPNPPPNGDQRFNIWLGNNCDASSPSAGDYSEVLDLNQDTDADDNRYSVALNDTVFSAAPYNAAPYSTYVIGKQNGSNITLNHYKVMPSASLTMVPMIIQIQWNESGVKSGRADKQVRTLQFPFIATKTIN